MPELPEVEVQRRAWVRWMRGHQVVGAEAEASRAFRGSERKDFLQLRGKLRSSERRGKYMLLHFDSHSVLSHLGMTGKWVKRRPDDSVRFSRAQVTLDSGAVLHFTDPRRFGRLELAESPELLRALPVIRDLGIDPLVDGLTPETLKEAVGRAKTPLKVALMDQARIAGLGNIHAAEALYRARIDPRSAPSTLKPADWKKLTSGIHAALQFALDHEDGGEIQYVEEPGSPNPFLVYGRGGEKCRRCHQAFTSVIQGGRTTYFCPGCQKRPRSRTS